MSLPLWSCAAGVGNRHIGQLYTPVCEEQGSWKLAVLAENLGKQHSKSTEKLLPWCMLSGFLRDCLAQDEVSWGVAVPSAPAGRVPISFTVSSKGLQGPCPAQEIAKSHNARFSSSQNLNSSKAQAEIKLCGCPLLWISRSPSNTIAGWFGGKGAVGRRLDGGGKAVCVTSVKMLPISTCRQIRWIGSCKEHQYLQPLPCSDAFSDVLPVSALFVPFMSCSGFLGSEAKLSTLEKAAL